MNSKRAFDIILQIILIILGGFIVISSFLTPFTFWYFLLLLFGLAFLFGGIFYFYLKKHLPLYLKNTLLVCLLLFLAVFLFVYFYGANDNADYNEEAVIVLGAGIKGEELSESLKMRLDCALEYHSNNPDAVIIVTGGQGPYEDITEALAMERYLSENGVPKEKILKEEAATSTKENFEFSKAILDDYFESDYNIVFITNNYHVFRSEFTAVRTGFKSPAHLHANTPWYITPSSMIREIFAVFKYLIFG